MPLVDTIVCDSVLAGRVQISLHALHGVWLMHFSGAVPAYHASLSVPIIFMHLEESSTIKIVFCSWSKVCMNHDITKVVFEFSN